MATLSFDKFDPKMVQRDQIVVLIGKKNTGKTTALKSIMYYKRNIPDGIVFSGSEESNASFREMCPDSYIYSKYDQDVMREFLKRAKSLNKLREKRGQPKKYSFVIIDDCAYDDRFVKHETLRELFMNGRHYGIFVILTLQYCMQLPLVLRGQIDWIGMCRENNPAIRKRLYDQFSGGVYNLHIFNQILDQTTNNYHMLWYRNTGTSNNPRDMFYWFKAPLHRPFRIGSKSYWKYHRVRYDEHYDSDNDDDPEDGDTSSNGDHQENGVVIGSSGGIHSVGQQKNLVKVRRLI
jgi:hypothetical protein